jgi:hypothetical protein
MEIYGSGGAEVSLINLNDTSIPSETVRVMTIDSFVKTNGIGRV